MPLAIFFFEFPHKSIGEKYQNVKENDRESVLCLNSGHRV